MPDDSTLYTECLLETLVSGSHEAYGIVSNVSRWPDNHKVINVIVPRKT